MFCMFCIFIYFWVWCIHCPNRMSDMSFCQLRRGLLDEFKFIQQRRVIWRVTRGLCDFSFINKRVMMLLLNLWTLLGYV
jgi:hypothetical protein